MGKSYNKYILFNRFGVLQVSQDKYVLFDREDYEKISQHSWHIGGSENNYAYSRINGKHTTLQRFLTDCPDGLVVDHINHDTYDNRKENLRVCTQKENSHNRKRQGGVYKHEKKWKATIRVDGKRKYLGIYDTYEEALRVRKEAENKYCY